MPRQNSRGYESEPAHPIREAVRDATSAHMTETVILTLHGHCPSKKNRWRPRKGGGIMLDRDAADEILMLVTQARIAWGTRREWEHPALDVEFFVRNRRSDRDNKLGCLLDVLETARVIHKDNVMHFNGMLVLKPAIVAEHEKAVVTLTRSTK